MLQSTSCVVELLENVLETILTFDSRVSSGDLGEGGKMRGNGGREPLER